MPGWSTKASMPTPRYAAAAAELNGLIYVVGGRDATHNSSNLNECYDPATNTWTTKKEYVTAAHGIALVNLNGKLYGFGGANFGANTFSSSGGVYSPETNTWGMFNLPTSMRITYAAICAIQGKIYIAGGSTSTESHRTTLYEYNPDTKVFTEKSAMGTPRSGAFYGVVNAKFHVMGGLSGGSTASHECYDPVTNQWIQKASMPVAKHQGASFTIKNRIYAVGGYSFRSDVRVYDAESDTWLPERSTMPVGRHYTAGAAANGIGYTFGGSVSDNNYDGTTYAYDPTQDGQAWTNKASMSSARYHFAATTHKGKIHVVGGHNTNYVTTHQSYDPATDTWSSKAAAPRAVVGASLHSVGSMLYFIGGFDGTTFFGDVDEYDPEKNTWVKKAGTVGFRNAQSGVINGKIYVHGGITNTSGTVTNLMREYDPAANKWATKRASGTTRHSGASVVLDGKLYVLGGYANANRSATVSYYDPATDLWTSLRDLPIAGADWGAAAVRGMIYLFGGETSNGSSRPDVYVYDPKTGVSGRKTSMPEGKYRHSVISVSDVIFVIGGTVYGGGNVSTVTMYDPVFDPWSKMSRIPTARHGGGAAAVNNLIYVIGGFNLSGTPTNANECYDPTMDTWTTKTPIPSAKGQFAIGAINGKVYVASGFTTVMQQNTHEYDPSTNQWTTMDNIPLSRRLCASAVLDGLLYAVGGAPSTASTKNTQYDPVLRVWTDKKALSVGREGATGAAIGGKVYVIGGASGGSPVSRNECYDPATNTWEEKSPMPTARQALSTTAIAIGSIIIVAGGRDASGAVATVERYDTETDKWSTLPNLPDAAEQRMTIGLNGRGYVFGGVVGTSQIFETVYEIVPGERPSVMITSPSGTPSAPGGTPLPAVIHWKFYDPEGLPQTQFQLTIYNADTDTQIHTIKTLSATEQYTVPDGVLVLGGRYYGELTAWDAAGLTGTAERFYFVTSQIPTVSNPHPSGTLEAPGGGSMIPRLQLDYFDPEGGAISKSQWILVDVNGSPIYDSGEVFSDNRYYDVPTEAGLQAGQVYGWKGRVADNHGVWSEFTEIQYFITNHMPGALTPISPENTYRTGPRPVFIATIGDDVENDGQKFVLQIADDQGFTNGVQEFSSADIPAGWEAKTTAGEFAPITGDGVTSDFEGGQVRYTLQTDLTERKEPYYWRIASVDASSGAQGPWSEVRSIRSINRMDFERVGVITGSMLAERILINLISTISTDGPTPAQLKVEVTNNGLDDSPVWEDATQAVLFGDYHTFTNNTKTADEGAVKVRITVQANDSMGPIEISDIAYSFD